MTATATARASIGSRCADVGRRTTAARGTSAIAPAKTSNGLGKMTFRVPLMRARHGTQWGGPQPAAQRGIDLP